MNSGYVDAFTLDLIYKDVAAILDELLANTLPKDKKEPATKTQNK